MRSDIMSALIPLLVSLACKPAPPNATENERQPRANGASAPGGSTAVPSNATLGSLAGSGQVPTHPDAPEVARARGTSVAAADDQLALEAATSEPIRLLREEFQSRLSGVYTTGTPEYKIVVRLAGAESVADRELRVGARVIPVEFQTGAPSTLAQQTADLQSRTAQLKKAVPTLQGAGSDEAAGEIVLHVLAVGAEQNAILAKKAEIVQLLGHPVRFEFTTVPSSNL